MIGGVQIAGQLQRLGDTPLELFCFNDIFIRMTRILACDQSDPGDCPGDWEKLPPAGERDIRVCPVCLKAVYRCASAEEARLRAAAGHHAAVAE